MARQDFLVAALADLVAVVTAALVALAVAAAHLAAAVPDVNFKNAIPLE